MATSSMAISVISEMASGGNQQHRQRKESCINGENRISEIIGKINGIGSMAKSEGNGGVAYGGMANENISEK